MGSETDKIYYSFFYLLFPFIHDQTDPRLGSLCGRTKRRQHKGKEGEPTWGRRAGLPLAAAAVIRSASAKP